MIPRLRLAALGAILFLPPAGLAGAAPPEPRIVANPPPAPVDEEKLEPLTCATQRPDLPPHLARILDLRFSPSMLDSAAGGWSGEDVRRFASLLVDGHGTAAPGPLSRVWAAYGPGPGAGSGDSLRFTAGGRTYRRIRVDVYLPWDCCRNRCGEGGCPSAWPDSCREGGWVECNGYGVYRGGNLLLFPGGSCATGLPDAPETVARSPVFAHEMAHLAHRVRDPGADVALSELLATGAEYFVGERWDRPPDAPRSTEYDVSLKSGSPENLSCSGREVGCKYNVFRLWNAYLYAHFPEDRGSGNLVHAWVRRAGSRGAGPTWRGFGEVLMDPAFADRVPGATAGEKLGCLLHRFAIARYADAPGLDDGRYGFGPGVSTRALRFFEWPDTVALPRRRAIPPVLALGPGDSVTASAWTDPVQPWGGEEPCRVLTTGADYVVIVAEDGATPGHASPLRIRIEGRAPLPEGQTLRAAAILYADPEAARTRGLPMAVVEDAGSPIADGTPGLDVYLGEFGGRVRGAVIVLTLAEIEPSESFLGVAAWDYAVTAARWN